MIAQQLRIQGVALCALLAGEIAVDLFAGGGGASSGIEEATGISPAIAINHDAHAIKMHEANHPNTIHFCQSVHHREVHPRTLVAGMKIGLLWLSPDCRHFSRAKGSAPVSDTVRSLAWIGLRWAKFARPRIVVLENVAEFLTWGPLLPDGTANKARAGETFAAFVREWRSYGYQVEWRTLVAADYGAPTTRKRLFLVARRDGVAISWPSPTHGKLGKPKPWRTAAECIDWAIPTRSIFGRKKPLAEATCRRIARGIGRYVLEGKPFLVETAHGDHVKRAGARCQSLDRPMGHITKVNSHALVAANMIRMSHGEKQWRGVDEPLCTVLSGANHHGLVTAFLDRYYGGKRPPLGASLEQPLPTVTQWDHHALVAGSLIQIGARHEGGDQGVDAPMATLLTTERFALVAAFLVQYYSTGTQDQPLTEPMATIVSRARHGLVTVTIDGAEYAIADIGMRMLEPHELAAAQGFDPAYILTGTKSQKIARIGNSVCPPVAAAVLRANLPSPERKQVA